MKKLFLAVLAVVLCLSFTACTVTVKLTDGERELLSRELKDWGFTIETEEIHSSYTFELPVEEDETAENISAGLVNPRQEYGSLEEINTVAGVALAHPAVMGVSDEYFVIIDDGEGCIAEYDYTLAGCAWCFRASAFYDRDISGVYINGELPFGEVKEGIEYAEGEGYKLARFATIDGQYVLMVQDNGQMDAETFRLAAEEQYELVNPAWTAGKLEAYYASLAGSWSDEMSQRATMEITACGSECLQITVHWSSSATECDIWEMTAKVSEDGLIYYSNCVHSRLVFTDADDTATVLSADGEGYFSHTPEGKLAWNGATDADCTECVFVMD